jgi:hypothetical protein
MPLIVCKHRGVARPVAFKCPTSAVSVNSPQLTLSSPMVDVSLYGQSVLEVWLWLDRQRIAHFYHLEPGPWRVGFGILDKCVSTLANIIRWNTTYTLNYIQCLVCRVKVHYV